MNKYKNEIRRNTMQKFDEQNPYEPLSAIMSKFGAECSPKEFYWSVNIAYHRAEAAVYDEKHEHMFSTLQLIWKRLLSNLPNNPKKLVFLDVGAGTGLVGHFLNLYIPDRVEKYYALDPSQAMLDRCRGKSESWVFPSDFVHGDLSSFNNEILINVVTVNSVLHHIVELQVFFSQVQDILDKGGLLLTAQDPRQEAINDEIYLKRINENTPKYQASKLLKFRQCIVGMIRKFKKKPYPQPVIVQSVCNELLENGIITKPIDKESIYSVTDFHVHRPTYGIGKGIARNDLISWLTNCELLDYFSYQFLGWPPWLNEKQKKQEIDLWKSNDPHGLQFGSAWRLLS
jgi:ubiquinone/menaquinone biosynthesis C-methylase UbiE